MRFRWIISLTALLLAVSAYQYGQASVKAGPNIKDGEVRNFYLAVGDYYKVPEKTVVVVREKNIRDEELPVVFFLAREAKVRPETIVKMRSSGKSWMDITRHYGLSPKVFYVPLSVEPGPPYGKAYGHYKKHPKNKWNEIRLKDADVVNLVNLKFVSKHYGCSPDEVVKMRSSGKSFVVINRDVKKVKEKSKQKDYNRASMPKTTGKDKGKR